MKERPILMSAPMVRAILEGRKTQTRRIMKPQPTLPWNNCTPYMKSGNYQRAGIHFEFSYDDHVRRPEIAIHPNLPFWEQDVLWVRETWRKNELPIGYPYEYRATAESDGTPTDGPWKPSIFMPREACRILLVVTGVRAERLRDISERDAIAEGIEKTKEGFRNYGKSHPLKEFMWGDKAILSYMSLWESINGKGSWYKDPWVWVIDFKQMQP